MKPEIDFIGIFFSFVVTIIFWKILIVPARSFIAFIIGIIFFLTYRYIVYGEKELIYNLPTLKFKKILLAFLVLLSILSVLFIHPISETVEFIPWNSIPILNLLRLLLSSFLLLFFPGYIILSLIDRSGSLSGTEKIFFSVLINLLLFPFLGCFSFLLGASIQKLGVPFTILLNLILLILYILKGEKPKIKKLSISLNEKLILFSLLIFMLAIMLSKYSLNLTWDYGDLDQYYGYSVSFTKYTYPISILGPGRTNPFWLFIFLAESFILTGVPYANTFQFVTVPIIFLPILSFYTMNLAFFEARNKKIPIIATIFGFFGGGFGWIFGVHLLSSSQTVEGLYELFSIAARTDSGYLALALYPLYTLFPYYLALTTIFALIWLVYSKHADSIGNLRYILICAMTALGYLTHISETLFFIFIFFISILIFKHEDASSYRKCALSTIFGLMLVPIHDTLMHGSFYTGMEYFGFTIYYGALTLLMLAFSLSFVKGRLKAPFINFKVSPEKIRILKIACSSLIVYFYASSFIILSGVYKTYNRLPTQMHKVPWYAWPNRLGICGLIALLGVIYLIHKSKNIKEYSFFILLVPVSFMIARVLHVYPFYLEDRITFFLMIPTVILTSYVLLEFNRTLRRHLKTIGKNILFGFVLSIVLIMGFLPPLFIEEAIDFNYWTQPVAGEKLSALELGAFNFLRLNTPPSCSVLTVTARSKYLLSYAGLSEVQTYVNRNPYLIFNPLLPETTLYSLMKSQVKYVYLTSADKKELEQNSGYSAFANLLKYLPISFQNKGATIYELPDFSIPTNSSTALVTSNVNIGYFKDIFDETYDKYCRFCSVLNAGDTITVKTNNQRKNHDFELPVNINPNEYPYVTIRWKTDGTKLYFYLLSSDNVYYTLLGRSTSWQTTTINLNHFYDVVRKKTVSVEPNEQIISILFRDFELDSKYSIDYLQFVGFPNNDAVSGFFPLSTAALSQIEYSTVLEDDPARFHYSTLILTHDLNIWSETVEQDFQRYLQWTDQGGRLIVLESLGAYPPYEYRNLTKSDYIRWRDENFTTGWIISGGSATLDGNSVTVQTNDENINHDFFSPMINVSVGGYPYIVVRWKTDGSRLYSYPHSAQSNFRYITLGASTEWTTSTINLKNIYDCVLKNFTSFEDDEQIDKLLFRSFTGNATYSIDYVEFYKEYPLPMYPVFANMLSIYTEGTLEADGVESQTGGLNFPSVIRVPVISSSDTNTKIIANYTMNNKPVSPYAITKKIGKGEVIYLAVSPYFSVIDNSTGDIKRDFFRDIGSLLNVLNLELNKNIVKRTNYFPQFDYIKEPVNLTGKVSVDTDYIQLPKLDVNCIKILSNDGKMETINLNNSTIEKIEYTYPVKFGISASEVSLSAISLGRYLNIEIVGDFNLTLEIPKNSTVKMSIRNSTTLLDRTFQESTVQVGIKNNYYGTPVLLGTPTIVTEGNAFFNKARIYRNHYKMPLFYNDGSESFEVVGNVTFKIEYSDNCISFVDNFTFNGKWFCPIAEQKKPQFTEMDIPWFGVLTSPLHMLLATLTCAVLIAYTYPRLKRRRTRTKLKLR
jgi:hypothetical protein